MLAGSLALAPHAEKPSVATVTGKRGRGFPTGPPITLGDIAGG
ncbi:hypothetical protein Mbo2_108 [Rhodococcus phage Mbo2]|uniref:Uncharacterized protein n=1 Tax=Rhodococcus phage Mbo2 TaxID=2936911 RepID=A0A9E7IGQ0_9CAUD|nr:hypothetical protein Mbo2_107 [Rhodococcus phage Mbo2]URG17478.1 hypothetical protein Mbo2_108 [Rhodococcus phage Mbo2]